MQDIIKNKWSHKNAPTYVPHVLQVQDQKQLLVKKEQRKEQKEKIRRTTLHSLPFKTSLCAICVEERRREKREGRSFKCL